MFLPFYDETIETGSNQLGREGKDINETYRQSTFFIISMWKLDWLIVEKLPYIDLSESGYSSETQIQVQKQHLGFSVAEMIELLRPRIASLDF